MNNKQQPDIIYHYTSQDGLISILNNQQLWATKIQYMNDSSEFDEPIRIAREVLDDILDANPIDNSIRNEFTLNLLFETDMWDASDNICIVSFCADGNLLGQWRGYGSPGSNFSIGFNRKKLNKNIKSLPFKLHQCKYYSPEEYKEEIKKFISNTLNKTMENNRLPSAQTLYNQFIRAATTMKLNYFREECELRLVSSMLGDSDLKFRVHNSMIIPYYPIQFDISSISEIIIGPSHHQNLVLRSVSQLVHIVSPKHKIIIKESRIPYRVL